MRVVITGVVTIVIRRLAGAAFTWEPLPALALKGKAEPVAVYRLQSRRADAPALQWATLARQSMIGRQGELAQLEAALDALARTRAGRTVVLEGEPGIGKSQLAEAVLVAARGQRVRILLGGGDAVEQSTPAFAWRSIFSQLLGPSARAADVLAQQQYVHHTRTPSARAEASEKRA